MHQSPEATAPLIALSQVCKSYQSPAGSFPALSGISFSVGAGEFVAIIGKSGSGKSTLVNVMTGIDTPSSGTIAIGRTEIQELSEDDLARWRGRTVGVVFQFFQLLPTLTIAENVMLPMDFCNSYPPAERRPRALDLLAQLGIGAEADKLPATLSGGQQQRAAIARALANDPPLLVADEPTGNLDTRTASEVMALFGDLVRAGRTVVMVTHDRDHDNTFTRTIELADGRMIADQAGDAGQ